MSRQAPQIGLGASAPPTLISPKPMQLKLEAWPKIDRALWTVVNGPIDILDTNAPPSEWRAATIKNVKKSYGRWLRWLDDEGLLDGEVAPSGRVTKVNIGGYVAALRATLSTQSVHCYIQGLTMAISRMEPTVDVRWLWDIVNRLHRHARPSRIKRERIVASKKLFDFGQSLMARAVTGDALADAIVMRDGLLIALLIARPIRIRNLHMIEIGTHLVRSGKGYELRFTEHEIKTHKELVTPVPAILVPAIDIYLEQHRPVLLNMAKEARAPAGMALWITRFGTRMAEISLHKRISELTAARFGRSVNPHLFRDCAATSIALDDPDHIHITMGLLGHGCIETSQRYYNHALSRNAAAIHQSAICALRKKGRSAAGQGPKRPSTGRR